MPSSLGAVTGSGWLLDPAEPGTILYKAHVDLPAGWFVELIGETIPRRWRRMLAQEEFSHALHVVHYIRPLRPAHTGASSRRCTSLPTAKSRPAA